LSMLKRFTLERPALVIVVSCSRVTFELYSVNSVEPCLIILFCSTRYCGRQKENLNKLLQKVSIIYSFDGLGIGNQNNVSVIYAKPLRGVCDIGTSGDPFK